METYYYNVDINCDIYFKGGVIERDVELYSDVDNLEQDVEDYIVDTYGERFLEHATEYGPLEIIVNNTDDPNSPYYEED